MILIFHIQHYLHNSKKWHKWHSLAANFTYGTLKSGLDLQCGVKVSIIFQIEKIYILQSICKFISQNDD